MRFLLLMMIIGNSWIKLHSLSLSVSLRAIYRNDCDGNNILIGEQRSVIVVVVIPKVCNETSGWVDMEISMHIGCCHLRDINDLFKNV